VRHALVPTIASTPRQGAAFFIREIVAVVVGDEIDHGPFRKRRRLVENQPTV
jgi:hypothetical protein